MANAFFDFGRENVIGGDIDYDAATIKIVCVDHADDNPAIATDDALDDIAAAGRVATSGAFATKTKTAGVYDADDVTITAVSGDPFESGVIYKDTGTESTSLLLIKIDTATGLPLTPSGSDVTWRWDNGANKIAKI